MTIGIFEVFKTALSGVSYSALLDRILQAALRQYGKL